MNVREYIFTNLSKRFQFLFFVCLATIQLQPVNPLSQIPTGTEITATVPIFNLWTVQQNVDFALLKESYWNASVFYPESASFAFSEAQPPLMLLTPVATMISPLFAYNLFAFLMLTLNGLFGYQVSRKILSCGRFTAFFCGGMIQLMPFANQQLGVLQLIAVWPVLLVLAACFTTMQQGTLRSAFGAGVSLGVSYLFCNNYGMMAAVLFFLTLTPPILLRFPFKKCLQLFFVAAFGFLLVSGAVVVKQLEVLTPTHFDRETETVASLAAQVSDFAVSPWGRLPLIPGLPNTRLRPFWGLSCGIVNYILAVCGIFVGIRSKSFRSWTSVLTVLWFLSMSLAIIPGEPSHGQYFYTALCRIIPGLSRIRSVYRFVMFSQMAVIMLAGVFLAVCERTLIERNWTLQPARLKAFAGVASVALIAAVAEVFPKPSYVCTPIWQSDPPFCQWLRTATSEDQVLACFPFPPGRKTPDFEHEVAWMIASKWHRRAIVNGYSGFFPLEYAELKETARLPPDETLLRNLQQMQVAYILVHEDWLRNLDQEVPNPTEYPGLKEVYYDPANTLRIFRIESTLRNR